MAGKAMKVPGHDHPISIDANPSHVVVTVGGKVIADTHNPLPLRESSYPPFQYTPRRDVYMPGPTPTQHPPLCPERGAAPYHTPPGGGGRSGNGDPPPPAGML